MKTMYLIILSILVSILFFSFGEKQINAMPPFETPPQGGLHQCDAELIACDAELIACDAELIACDAGASFGVPQTGQTTCWDTVFFVISCAGTGQDGDIQAGVVLPSPRFTDNGVGTITDNLTGLIWLKNANCFGALSWADAVAAANTLNDGECGLTDSSVEGNWYLPNVNELRSLTNFAFSDPAISNAAGTAKWTENDAFTGVQSSFYWSSTTGPLPGDAWYVVFERGNSDISNKGSLRGVIAVRDGS
jgi:hypothetical protein